jgi:hypothetical protein
VGDEQGGGLELADTALVEAHVQFRRRLGPGAQALLSRREGGADGVGEAVAPGVGLRHAQGDPGAVAAAGHAATVRSPVLQAVVGLGAGGGLAQIGAGQVGAVVPVPVAEGVADEGGLDRLQLAPGLAVLLFQQLLGQWRQGAGQQQGEDEQHDGQFDQGEAARPRDQGQG